MKALCLPSSQNHCENITAITYLNCLQRNKSTASLQRGMWCLFGISRVYWPQELSVTKNTNIPYTRQRLTTKPQVPAPISKLWKKEFPVCPDRARGEPDPQFQGTIPRNGKTKQYSLRPRGKLTDVFLWTSVTGPYILHQILWRP